MKTSVIIPCYNEGDNLEELFRTWMQNIEGHEIEVIFVDNGSIDNSKEIFKRLSVKFKKYSKNFKVLELTNNKGYGGGIQEGLNIASGQILSWCHADGQIEVGNVITAIEEYKQDSNRNIIIKGKRKNRNAFDLFFTKMMSAAVKLFTGYSLTDINAQPKIFSKTIYTNHLLAKDFMFDLDFLLHQVANGLRIKEVDVSNLPRLKGKAKGGGSLFGKITLSLKTLRYLINFNE